MKNQSNDDLQNIIFSLLEILEFYANDSNYKNNLIILDNGKQAKDSILRYNEIIKEYDINPEQLEDYNEFMKQINL